MVFHEKKTDPVNPSKHCHPPIAETAPSSVFHLDLQRHPQTQRLAAALWMAPSIASIASWHGMMDLVAPWRLVAARE